MNIFTKPRMNPPGTKGPGVLVVKMQPRSEINPCEVWRVVDGKWKLVTEDKPVVFGRATETNNAARNGTKAKKDAAAKAKKKKKK